MALPPENGWEAAARELVAARMCTADQAREKVTLHYLLRGDCRALLDWALRGHVHSVEVMRVVAAMLDGQHRQGSLANFPFEFRFQEIRRPGRPKRGRADGPDAFAAAKLIIRQMAAGIDPGRHFWLALTQAVAQGNPNWIWRQHKVTAPFPLRAKLVAIKRGRGRRRDPELSMRDKVLFSNVQQKIDKGEPYKSAIYQVVEKIEGMRRREGSLAPSSRDLITDRTVRNAYDRAVRGRR